MLVLSRYLNDGRWRSARSSLRFSASPPVESSQPAIISVTVAPNTKPGRRDNLCNEVKSRGRIWLPSGSTLAGLIWVVVYLSGAMTKEAVGCTASLMPENTVTLGGESALIDKLCVTAVNGIAEGAERRPHRKVHSVTPESPKPRFPKEAKVPKGTDLDGHMIRRHPVAKSPSGRLGARHSAIPRNKILPIDGLVPWLVQRIGRHKNGVNTPLHGRKMMGEVEEEGGQLSRRQWYR